MRGTFEIRCGTVKAIHGSVAVIALARGKLNPACAHCGACGATPPEGVDMRVPIAFSPPLRPGDTVRVRCYVANPALVSAVVFGLPLIGLIAALIVVLATSPQAIDSPLAVAAALGGLGLGGLTAWALARSLSRKHPPSIVGSE